MKKIRIIQLVITLIFIIPINAFPQVNIMRVDIKPLNRVIIYCSEIPSDFYSELSPEKTKITIKIQNSNAVESSLETHSEGIVRDVFIQNFKKFAQISINLSDRRGYNSVPLPYSKALMLEVFDWQKLDRAEDFYRSGLLALEDRLIPTAKKLLMRAAHLGNYSASAFLGILQIGEGNIQQALDNLLLAEKNNINLPDLYAALSQVYSIKGDAKKAELYKKLFTDKSGLSTFVEIKTGSLTFDEPKSIDTISFLSRIFEPTPQDSADSKSLDSIRLSRGGDSLKSHQLDDKRVSDSTPKQNVHIQQGTSNWLIKTIVYILIFAGIFVIMLLSLYLKWRKKKILQNNTQNRANSDDEFAGLKSKHSGTAEKAANIYNKVDKLVDEEAITPKEIIPEKAGETQILQLAKEIIASKTKNKEPETHDKTKVKETIGSISDKFDTEQTKIPVSGKFELALHLQQEQLRLKTQKIDTIKSGQFSFDESKLSEVARKLGIEKGSVETSMKIASIEKDESSKKKLADKFFVKKLSKKK